MSNNVYGKPESGNKKTFIYCYSDLNFSFIVGLL